MFFWALYQLRNFNSKYMPIHSPKAKYSSIFMFRDKFSCCLEFKNISKFARPWISRISLLFHFYYKLANSFLSSSLWYITTSITLVPGAVNRRLQSLGIWDLQAWHALSGAMRCLLSAENDSLNPWFQLWGQGTFRVRNLQIYHIVSLIFSNTLEPGILEINVHTNLL